MAFSPGLGSVNYHLGATVQIADLDGNGRGEVMMAAALSRVGASVSGGIGSGGTLRGRLYIVWDDTFDAAVWPTLASSVRAVSLDDPPGPLTVIEGATTSRYTTNAFGEELIGGGDYDGDGAADLFVGDLVAERADRLGTAHGAGFVLWNAAGLRGEVFSIDRPPSGQRVTTFLGPGDGAIGGDTAMHGDFDGDGLDDLAFSSPHANALGRRRAGFLHVAWGQRRPWPEWVDLRPGYRPPFEQLTLTTVYAARGETDGNQPDTLAYSGAYGDIDGDGLTDIITNEMTGDGAAPGTEDVGNLLVIAGDWLACPPP
jgi:hypothetical protein